MEKKMLKVIINGEVREYPEGIPYEEIITDYQGKVSSEIILVTADGRLRELHKRLKNSCELKFVTTKDSIGYNTYVRSAILIMLKAIFDVAGQENVRKVINHYSLGNGRYFTMEGSTCLSEEFLLKVKERMTELSDANIPIMKRSVGTDEAIALFHKHKMYDKERLFHYRRVSKVHIYSLEGFEDYFYGYMACRTGYIKKFDLQLYDEGFVLQLPSKRNPKQVPPFEPQNKLFQVMKESCEWGERQDLSTVGALNDRIAQGRISELILVQEALQEKKIAEIAQTVSSRPDVKLVMIAGPSSSGKTTFSHRLSVQLMAHGMRPHPIAVDNYFVDREDTPLDEFGQRDYECLGAIDVEGFNRDMNRLLAGETVEIPEFNFKKGKREYKGNYITLGKEDILVIEGIHCLNDALSYSLPKEKKFKIYISALTQLNIDEHNRIPTTDGRLIRRMVRDARTRGTSAKNTIAMWPSVRRGEERNIFPYQETADVMFNSALIYELAVLKQYAEPVLFGIGPQEPEYQEAKRLLKFLDYFIGIPSEEVPKNSLLREFLGGGCFKI